MNFNYFLKTGYKTFRQQRTAALQAKKIKSYINNGRKPWSEGYSFFKEELIKKAINDENLIEKFRKNDSLPEKFGEFVDERIIEYPWLISRLTSKKGTLLDAGSALNFPYFIQHPILMKKEATIVTLEPETNCFWNNRVSYLFADLRNLPLRDDWFDEVASISTLEHVGMNNSIYSSNPQWQEKQSYDFLRAINDLKRVTRPGGKVYITVPYGKYTDFGWYQQFNADLIDRLIYTFKPTKVTETYFCYELGGWRFSDKQYCQKFEGFNIHDTKYFNPDSTKDYDPDYAACSRAIAALELWK